MAWPAVKLPFTQEDFRRYVAELKWGAWRPSLIVLHNTAAPTLAQWRKSAETDKSKGVFPGTTRIGNLEQYFRYDQLWSGGPHLFIDETYIWVFNPLTAPGVHSPSWNSISIGIETVGDYAVEDDDSGDGLKVKNNAIFASAILCSTFGLDPMVAMKLHKEDPKTTHDCPGKDMAQDKSAIVSAIASLMEGGEHDPAAVSNVVSGAFPPPPPPVRHGTVTVDDLNFRAGPGVTNESTGHLPKGTAVQIIADARNGTTSWLRVKTPAGYIGWVSAKYVQIVS